MSLDLASLLNGGAAQHAPAPPPLGGGERQPIQLLKQAIDLLHHYQQIEPDVGDKAAVSQIAAKLLQILAKDQQDTQQALGSPAATKVLGRAFGGGQ